jgi:ABC-2 type transport system permease protein
MTIFRFALLRSLRNPVNLLLLAVLPAGLAFVPRVPGTVLPLGYHLYGQVVMFAAFLMVRTTLEDRLGGTTARVAAAPIRHARWLGGTLLAYGVLLVLQNALFVATGALRHGIDAGTALLQLAVFAAFSLASLAFALAGCALFDRREYVYSAVPTLITLLSLVGGFYAPVEIMPRVLQKAAMVTPPYWLMRALDGLARGDDAGRFVVSVAIVLLFAMAFLVVGSSRRVE